MIGVVYHDDLKEVQDDSALIALLAAPHARAPFDRIEWWQGLSDRCGLTPLVAVATDGGSRAALALTRQGKELRSLANWYSFRVRPVATPGEEERMLTALARDLARQSPRVELSPLPDDAGEATLLAKAFRAAGWLVFVDPCDVNHVLPVNGRSFAGFLAERPGPLRTTLKRKAGKVDVTITDRFDPAEWQAYEEIYGQSWKPEEGSPAFLRDFAQAEGAAGRLRLAIARHDGRPVAAQFWTVEGGTAFIHKLAHTQDSRALSPGTTLSAALFERVIDVDKVDLVDFGTGDDPYKRDWMEQIRIRYKIEAFRPLSPGNWPAIAVRTLRRLARGKNRG